MPALATTAPVVAQVQASDALRWTAGQLRQPPPFDACCTIVPFSKRWVDPNGLRQLKEERMLNERDLAHLLEEAQGLATETSMPLAELAPHNHEEASDQRRHRVQKYNDARVLHLDLAGTQSLAALTESDRAKRLAAACNQEDARYCQRIVRVLRGF